VERLQRTLKGNLKNYLCVSYSRTSESDLKKKLQCATEDYNSNPHKHNCSMFPHAMDEAFFFSPVKADANLLLFKNDLKKCRTPRV
jgi:hypothetical protein